MKSTFKYISLIAAMLILVLCSGVYAQKNDKLRGIKLSGNPDTPHKVFVVFDSTPGQSENNLVKGLGGSIRYTYQIVPAIAATIPEAAIEGLQKNSNVVAIEAVGIVTIHSEEVYEWNISQIGSDIVHTVQTNKGEGVKIAIIDTGIDDNHSEFVNNYAGGYDFVNSDNDPYDDHSHGTHVAGIIAAEENGQNIIGVAPNAQLFALKVLNAQGSGGDDDIVAALEWILDYNNDPSLNEGSPIRITNNSYAGVEPSTPGFDPSTTIEDAFTNLYNQGVLHVAASGNSNDEVQYPAKFNSVIAVGATDSNDARAWFSCYGPELELSAPGVSINSTVPSDTYALKSGTSMASPHVAGVAALVISAQLAQGSEPINPNEIRERMKATADDLGDPGLDVYYGWGLVDADEAANLSSVVDNPPSVSIINPTDGDTISNSYTVVVEAVDDFGVYSVDLQIVEGEDAISMTKNEDGSWEYVWETTPDEEDGVYEDGTYQLTATATDTFPQTTDSEPITITVNNSCVIQVKISSASAIPVPGGEAAEIVFTVTDNSDSPLPLVSSTVQGEWSGLVSGGVSATTDEYGMVTFQSNKTRQSGDIKFKITDIPATGCAYDTSNPTTVTVLVNEPVNEPINEKPSASFTYTCDNLTCSFDASSSDDDGEIVSYLWDFGDDSQPSELVDPICEYGYEADGFYDVTLTVTDNDGLSDVSTQNITVGDISTKPITVSGLVNVSTSIIRNKWTAGVEITVDPLVSGATVTGNWSGGASGTDQCFTEEVEVDGDAVAVGTVTYTGIKGKEASATFTITGINYEGYDYAENPDDYITVYPTE